MKYVYLIIGAIGLVLAVVGIVVPLLPTVPLLLLAALCFSKGSPTLHQWLLATKIYQNYGADFIERGGLTRRAKVRILCTATMMMLVTFALVPMVVVRIFIGVLVVITFIIFFTRIPTLEEGA